MHFANTQTIRKQYECDRITICWYIACFENDIFQNCWDTKKIQKKHTRICIIYAQDGDPFYQNINKLVYPAACIHGRKCKHRVGNRHVRVVISLAYEVDKILPESRRGWRKSIRRANPWRKHVSQEARLDLINKWIARRMTIANDNIGFHVMRPWPQNLSKVFSLPLASHTCHKSHPKLPRRVSEETTRPMPTTKIVAMPAACPKTRLARPWPARTLRCDAEVPSCICDAKEIRQR